MNKETVKSCKSEYVECVKNKLSLDNNPIDDAICLKKKINDLLWEELPEGATIGEAEIIACHIFTIIRNVEV